MSDEQRIERVARPMPERPLTAEAAAKHLGCSAAHVRNLCARGELRHFRLGRLLRIPAAALVELETCGSSGSEARSTPTTESTGNRGASRSELRIVRSPNGD